jgi:hypothetical protein
MSARACARKHLFVHFYGTTSCPARERRTRWGPFAALDSPSTSSGSSRAKRTSHPSKPKAGLPGTPVKSCPETCIVNRSARGIVDRIPPPIFLRASLHCVPASQNRDSTQHAKTARAGGPRLAGSSCARACGARNCSGGSRYGTTSQPSTPLRQAQGHLVLNAQATPTSQKRACRGPR